MTEKYDRHLRLKTVTNFRDIGGYKTQQGRTVAWRKIFRSGEFSRLNPDDYRRLTEELKLATILDLRSDSEVKRAGTGLPGDTNIKYCNLSFMTDDDDRTTKVEARIYKPFTNMGDFYLQIVTNKGFGEKIVQALEMVAEPQNHPLAFNCAIGKDRTGILAAMLLSSVGVAEQDIVEDYTLSDPYMTVLKQELESRGDIPDDVKKMPDFFWRAVPETMTFLLGALRKEYGSIADYLKNMGADGSLEQRLEIALLE
jgi:protein-tyrosine phosphatase